MDAFEMTEKLREKANVSYEEAKAALEANDWDMLDALVYLESRFSTSAQDQQEKETPNAGRSFGSEAEYTTRRQKTRKRVTVEATPRGFLKRLGDFLRESIDRGNHTYFEIYDRGELFAELPLTALLPLMLWNFRLMLFALLVGLFLGAKYRIGGGSIENGANRMMDRAASDMQEARYGGHEDEEQ